jgi:outer membrane protein assembly factor BamB
VEQHHGWAHRQLVTDDSVYALDASTGSLVWRFQTIATLSDQDVGAGPTISPPGVNGLADGAVYVDGKNTVEYALDLLTGSEIWTFNMQADSKLKANSVSTAAIVGSRVYVGYASGVYALDAVTGSRIWRTTDIDPATKNVLTSPAVSGAAGDQVLFVGDLSGGANGYRLSDGLVLWHFLSGGPIYASVAVGNSEVFVGSTDGNLYAFG